MGRKGVGLDLGRTRGAGSQVGPHLGVRGAEVRPTGHVRAVRSARERSAVLDVDEGRRDLLGPGQDHDPAATVPGFGLYQGVAAGTADPRHPESVDEDGRAGLECRLRGSGPSRLVAAVRDPRVPEEERKREGRDTGLDLIGPDPLDVRPGPCLGRVLVQEAGELGSVARRLVAGSPVEAGRVPGEDDACARRDVEGRPVAPRRTCARRRP
ncbi:MAG: hypothetical protein DYH08_01080 [Actinobacteria bacterium ATB1]|nr:hypothetical protein [Actinobacteria bacterium ATB1]